MSGKLFMFLAYCWFISQMICLVMEGSWFSTTQGSIINSLALFTTIPILNIITVPVFNVHFINGIVRLMMWDYSFYTGGWVVIRWFWMAVLDPGVIWGVIQSFIWLYGQAISLFTSFIPTV
jgi:hypothetical protein